MSRFTQADVDAFHARQAAAANRRNRARTPWPEPRKSPKSKESEAEIQEAIAAFLRSFGRDCQFVRSRMDKPTTYALGTPDFVGVLRGVAFALEVKRPGCKETREQAGQIMAWQLAGARVAVVHSLAEAVEFITERVLSK